MISKTSAAYLILQEFKKPLSAAKIISIALEREMIETLGLTPDATLNADLISENKRKNKSGKKLRFVRVGPQTWALTEWTKK